jgi:hypothetical protein
MKAKNKVLNWIVPFVPFTLHHLTVILTGFLSGLIFAVLLLCQGYFSWRHVHLLWSCQGLSTWSSDKCMYIYRMLRQNETLNCKMLHERLCWQGTVWMGVRSPLRQCNRKPCQGETEPAFKMIDFEVSHRSIRKQISFFFPKRFQTGTYFEVFLGMTACCMI